MKRLLKCFSLAAAALVLFAGCNQLGVSDATVDGLGASNSVKDGYCALTISADGLTVSSAKYASRTINPDSLEGSGSSNIAKYIIKGDSSTGANLGSDGIELGSTDAPSSGTNYTKGTGASAVTYPEYKVEIPYGSWELTLEAYDENDKLLLKGKSFVELKTAKSSIHFTLKTDGVSTAGHVNLAGTFTDTDNVVAKYSAGLYDIVTGKLIEGTDKALTAIGTGTNPKFTYAPETTVPADPSDPDSSATSVAKDIAPGRYSFQIKFFNSATTPKQVGYWEDIVVIAPGRTTTNTTINCGNIINRLPYHPKNLSAYLGTDSEDADGYTVILKWEDKSSNEENFVIYVDEYDATGAVTKTIVLGTEDVAYNSDTKIEKQNFFTSAMNAGGSIRASSTTASLKLPFGKLFDVRIQAENFVGLSEKFSPDDEGIETAAANCPRNGNLEAPAGSTYISSAKINRMVIDYDLNGGVLTLADTNEEYSGHYIVYKSIYEYADDARTLPAALLTIDDSDLDDTTKNRLVAGANEFTAWTKADGTSFATEAPLDLLTFAGIKVKASYDPNSLVSYEISDLYNSITATVKSGDTDITNGEVVRTENAALPLTFTAAGPTGTTIDWIKVKIIGPDGKNVLTSGKEANPYTTSLSKYNATGIYTVSITAHIDGKHQKETYSYTCTINVKDNEII